MYYMLFVRSKHLWTPVNIIIVNLAFSDFLMLSCLLLFVFNSMVQGPAIGYLCKSIIVNNSFFKIFDDDNLKMKC